MKKTYTINLSGKIFHIDEDALEKLQEYINTLKTYYTREEDGNEIMDDIENRIGELFTESLKGQFREVVTLEDVDQAIATMGTPDDIIDEDEQPRTSPSKQAKKLYRNPDDKILGGVAGGMAAYWEYLPCSSGYISYFCVAITEYSLSYISFYGSRSPRPRQPSKNSK